MRSASVGFQCPDCVAEANRGVRGRRSSLGRLGLGSRPGRITTALIAINVVVFLAGFVVPDLPQRFGELGLAYSPSQGGLVGVAHGQYYRLLTAAFLHAGLLHILFNMVALAQLGPPLEHALGPLRYLTAYVLAALGGSALSYLLSSPAQLGVGASGAIFGLFGAYYVVVSRYGGETGQILTLIVINLVITFAVPIIDWRAHLGGLATGALLAAAFVWAPRGRAGSAVQVGAALGVAAVIGIMVAVRTAALAAP